MDCLIVGVTRYGDCLDFFLRGPGDHSFLVARARIGVDTNNAILLMDDLEERINVSSTRVLGTQFPGLCGWEVEGELPTLRSKDGSCILAPFNPSAHDLLPLRAVIEDLLKSGL